MKPAVDSPRVVVVAESASAVFGGEAILPLHIFRKLRERGIEAWLVTHARTRDELIRLLPQEAGRMHFIPDTPFHIRMIHWGNHFSPRVSHFTIGFASRLRTQQLARQIVCRLVASCRADLVHQPVPVSPREPSLMAGFGVPVIMGPMNGGMTYPPAFEERNGPVARVSRIIALGRGVAPLLHRLMPGKLHAATLLVANERTRVALPAGVRGRVAMLIENGIDPATWIVPETDTPAPTGAQPATGRAMVVAFVGRLVDWKAVDVLLDALARVPTTAVARLDICGDGPMRPGLMAQADRLGLGGRVHFHGWVSQADGSQLLRTSDVLALPSLYECGGAVVLEAMACRLPVIATDWGGPADYLDATCGILVPPTGREDLVAGFAAALVRLAADPAERHRMGAAGFARVMHGELNWDHKIERMLDFYREAIDRAGSRGRPSPARAGAVGADPASTSGAGAPPEPRSAIELLVVIVNYRSAELAIDCLRSLAAEVAAYPGAHVALVENDSGADQLERLATEIRGRGWESWVTLIAAGRNGGFAAGNNVAIRWSLGWTRPPELFWLVNPDTIVRPGALAALAGFLAWRPGVGLAGSRLEHPDGTPQNSAFRFPSLLGEVEGGLRLGPVSRLLRDRAVVGPIADEPTAVDWVAGASLLIRRAVFEAVGLLDERYFMYYEEVDLCRRARDAGWPCWYVPGSRVVHLVGQSSDVTSTAGARKRRPAYWFAARNRYFRTHHGRVGSWAANVLHWGAFASYRLRRLVQRKPDHDPRLMLWDLFRHNFLPVKR